MSAVVRALRAQMSAHHPLLGFHAAFARAAFTPGIAIAALSVPRGSAKTTLAGHLAALSLRPGSPLFEPGVEVLGVSASLEQSRILLTSVKDALADVADDYRWLDSGQRLASTHTATGAKLRILSSSAKRAMGLQKFSTIFADEPASWEDRGGALMYRALRQSLGKREGQRLVLTGTRSPAEPGSWWPELLDAGSRPGIHVTERSADPDEPWDSYATIRRVNPLVHYHKPLREAILRERDEARRNEAERRWFMAYRLNMQVDATVSPLVDAEDWLRVERRAVLPREGRPILGIDLGGARAWSAAVCVWPNGRAEAYAVVAGIPDLAERERQDAVRRGLYRLLHGTGRLVVDEGLRVPRPERLIDHLVEAGIYPQVAVADRFRAKETADAIGGRWPLIVRQTRWSEATEDISGLRRLAKDGPLAVDEASRPLFRVSISESECVEDEQGNLRTRKRRNDRSRDDVAQALALACGCLQRELRRPAQRLRSAVV